MMPPTDSALRLPALVGGWQSHFHSADREIEWLAVEHEAQLWLTPNTLLLGIIDALGRDAAGHTFFGEWKTANPRERTTWKQTWRMNPQSLTYGVLAATAYPDCRRFTVRKAFKSDPPTFDHEWYSYGELELEHWRNELVRIADEIRAYREGFEKIDIVPWPTNYQACFKYGPKYACPFFTSACEKQEWMGKPADALVRISHLPAERRLYAPEFEEFPQVEELVVLDATRVKVWLDCRERYRREYEENVAMPPGEALQTGIDFHAAIAEYLRPMIRGGGV